MDQAKKKTERRRFTRIDFDATVTMNGDRGLWKTELVDISLKGVLADRPTDCDCEIGDIFNLTISLDEENDIEMVARVAHLHDELIGLECEEIDVESIGHVRQIIEQNSDDESLIYRELHNLGSDD